MKPQHNPQQAMSYRDLPSAPVEGASSVAHKSGPVDGVLLISPPVARHWLETRNGNNWRSIKPLQVAHYLRQMRDGLWAVTHEAIGFDSNGDLLDGQHRLAAIAEHDSPVRMRVVVGLEPSSREVIDSGMARSSSDSLAAAGYSNATTVATIVRFWGRRSGHYKGRKIANVEIVALAKAMPGLDAVASTSHSLYLLQPVGGRLFTAGAVGSVAYTISADLGAQTLRAFWDFVRVVGTGIGMADGSAELALVRRLQRERSIAKGNGRGGMSGDLNVTLLLLGFRAKMRGGVVSKLQMSGDESPTNLPYIDRA